MKIKNIKPVLTASNNAEDSLLMIGVHGIGKTDIVKEWSNENNMHLEILYLSSNDVGDLTGIPIVEDGVTIWTQPSWLDRMYKASEQGKQCALFLDEFSRAPLDVRQAALQLVLDKKIHQHTLPPKTFIMAADNPDNGEYAVEALDPALLDRFCVIDIDIDVESWLDWARENNINKIIRSFIAENKDKLHFQPEEGLDDRIGATPRSWAKLSKFVDAFNETPSEIYYNIVRGKVGKLIGLQFLNYYKNYKNIISVEDVTNLVMSLKNKKIEAVGKAIRELLKNTEIIQQRELTKNILDLYFKEKINESVAQGILYSLDNELLASILTELKEDDSKFSKIVDLDENNNKGLFIKLTNNLEF